MINLKLGHTKGSKNAAPQPQVWSRSCQQCKRSKYFNIREFALCHVGMKVAEDYFGLSSVFVGNWDMTVTSDLFVTFLL